MTKKAKKGNRKRAKPVGNARSRSGPMLDQNAAAYARLLADPCNAPVVHPIYTGGDSGYLFRAENFISVGTGATDTAGYLHWTPGAISSSSAELLVANGADPSTSLVNSTSLGTPGKTFLATNARGVRCVAACLRVSYPGSESSRSGRIHFGHTQAGIIDAGEGFYPNTVALLLQNYSRTPADFAELFWKPSAADMEMVDPSVATTGPLRDRHSALTLAWAGLPAGVGLTVHLTAVWEWVPAASVGITGNNASKAMSNNTLDQVLDYLNNVGFRFVHAAGLGAGATIGRAAGSLLSSTYGLMGLNAGTRRVGM